MHIVYLVLEYILIPVFGVIFTFIIRSLLSSARNEWKESLIEIFYDMMIMSIFSIVFFILGANAHSPNNPKIPPLTNLGFVTVFVLFIIIVGTAVYDLKMLKNKKEIRYEFIKSLTLICTFILVSFISYGVYVEHPVDSLNEKESKKTIILK